MEIKESRRSKRDKSKLATQIRISYVILLLPSIIFIVYAFLVAEKNRARRYNNPYFLTACLFGQAVFLSGSGGKGYAVLQSTHSGNCVYDAAAERNLHGNLEAG